VSAVPVAILLMVFGGLPQSIQPSGSPAYSWQTLVPTIVGFVQFLFLFFITIFVFLSNSAQKIRERQADWYHKVVVDYAVAALKDVFGTLQKELLQAAEKVEGLKREDPQNAKDESKRAIAGAKTTIFQLRLEMGFRLCAFDQELELAFTKEVEELENEIVAWFTHQPDRLCYEAFTSLPTILANAQMRLLHVLMRKEFATWGFTWWWSKRGVLPPK
jgi:hypothetical protein